MRDRGGGADGGDVVRVGGEGGVGGVILLEDTVGEWKTYASALVSVERSTAVPVVLFLFFPYI